MSKSVPPDWMMKSMDQPPAPKAKPAMGNLHAAKMHLAAAAKTKQTKKPVQYANPLKLSDTPDWFKGDAEDFSKCDDTMKSKKKVKKSLPAWFAGA